MALPALPAALQHLAGQIGRGQDLRNQLQNRLLGQGADIQPGLLALYNNAQYRKVFGPAQVVYPSNNLFLDNFADFPADAAGHPTYRTYNIDRLSVAGVPDPNNCLDYHGLMRNEAGGAPAGVIVNTESYRRGDPLYYFEAIFYAWSAYAAAFAAAQPQPATRLRWFLHTNIQNADTEKVIADLHEIRQNADPNYVAGHPIVWTFAANPNEVRALMGCELGNTTMRLLIEHCTGLGHRQIASIRTQPSSTGVCMLLFELQ